MFNSVPANSSPNQYMSYLDDSNFNFSGNMDLNGMDIDMVDANNMPLLNSAPGAGNPFDPAVSMALGNSNGTISSPATNLTANNMNMHMQHMDDSPHFGNTIPMPNSTTVSSSASPLGTSQRNSMHDTAAATTSETNGVQTRRSTRKQNQHIQPKPSTTSTSMSSAFSESSPDAESDTIKVASKPAKKAPARGGKRAKGGKRNSLERNRIAASKCREKKKNWIHDLEDTKATLEKKHHDLMSEYGGLVDELTELKNTLVIHANCNDANIDGWINNEAAKYVSRVRRDTQTTTASSDDQDASALSTPSDVKLPELPIPDVNDHAKMEDKKFDQNYLDDSMFNDDLFMPQPQAQAV